MIRKFTIVILVFSSLIAHADPLSYCVEPPSQSDQEKVKKLLSFVEVLFNTVGSEGSSAKEKNIIISQTYLKAFASDNVKVEDDLHAREVIINKDIQNYLKDVDIFFKNVKFDFEIKEVQKLKNAAGKDFLKVRTVRKLDGISFNNEGVKNEIERFIEVNLDARDDLKIASIYNAESNSRLTLQQWWKDLSFEWKVIFQRKLQTQINEKDALQLLTIKELDMSYNKYVQTLEPLNVLVNLKKLNISNTTVKDLRPLHGLSNLEELYISNTIVQNLDMVKKLPSLKIIGFESTEISDITPLVGLQNIQKIICTDTKIKPDDLAVLKSKLPECEIIAESVTLNRWWKSLDVVWQDIFRKHVTMLKLEPNSEELTQINEIKKLDISGMKGINDLAPLGKIKGLEEINASKSGIVNIDALGKMKGLKRIDLSGTYVQNIDPIFKHKKLEYLNLDYTQVQDTTALRFLLKHPESKVIFNSVKYIGMWIKMSQPWKSKLATLIGQKSTSSIAIDDFYEILRIKELDISGKKELSDLAGLQLVPSLRKLNISKLMAISDLTPITQLKAIAELDISYNPIESIELLGKLKSLKKLNIEHTKIQEIDGVENLKNLTSIKLSSTRVKNINALRGINGLTEVECNNTAISSLSPLLTLQHLKKISCYNTRLSNKDVENFKSSNPEIDISFY